MKYITLLFLFTITINVVAQMEKFPLLEPINNTIPESFIIEGDTNELIMFWIDSTDLHLSKSLDNGATWNTPTTLVDNENILDSLSDLNALKLNSGRILVTYKFKFHYSIYSDDNGANWSEPILLVTDVGSIRPRRVMESSLSQTDDNKIWFVYNRLNTIYNIQSDDGITWSEKDTIVVFQNGVPHFSSINSNWDGSLSLIYQLNIDDTTEIFQSTSVTEGWLWNMPKVIIKDGINKERPRVFRDSSKTLWLTYTQSDSTPFEEYSQTNIFYLKLQHGSEDWTSTEKFTTYTGFDGWQNISVAKNKPYIAFTSTRGSGFTTWYGIADESIDNTAPPSVYNTEFRFTNDYPNADVNINSKVYSDNQINSVMFNYTWGSVVDSIQLFDDGLHNDKDADDFIFGNDFLGLNYNFTFDYFITATDQFGNRVLTSSINVTSPFSPDGGDAFYFDNNNIEVPISSNGIFGDIRMDNFKHGGRFDDDTFLYSGGFAISGYVNGNLWASGQMTSSRVEDYIYGPVDSVGGIEGIHVVRSSQPDFYQSWTDWKDAVKQGADFYDGDGNGIYNPVDLNGNGIWDTNEDKPAILGDVTAYTVFNDGQPLRTFPNSQPQGIEIKQTVFSYNKTTLPKLGNVIFVRYNIENMGTIADKFDSVYFGGWVDFDLGNYIDDLFGTDTTLNSSYFYNDGGDNKYGVNPPSAFCTIVQGSPIYLPGETFVDINENGIYDDRVDTPLDSAKNRKGELLGIDEYPGAKNNRMTSSIHFIQASPTLGDPDNEVQLRNYLLGLDQEGDLIDPCNWEFGEVLNEDCSNINPRYVYSGDPVVRKGWLNKAHNEMRLINSTGPFDLIKGKPIEIIVAYIVGRGTDHLNSITEARRITNDVIGFYNTNFSYVPVGVKENTSSQLPTEFELMQNYPNPFNPSTTIKYQIPAVGNGDARSSTIVSLKVYDILGREVATLVNKEQKAGNYEVTFDASNLTSGVYFFRLKSGSFIDSKKMILLR